MKSFECTRINMRKANYSLCYIPAEDLHSKRVSLCFQDAEEQAYMTLCRLLSFEGKKKKRGIFSSLGQQQQRAVSWL